MTYTELKKDLDPEFKGMTKQDFINLCQVIEPRSRVGGPKGKGRLTAKRALAFLGAN
jgi:hypothetical protein